VKGEHCTAVWRQHACDERGQVVLLFALLLPMMLAMGAIVIGVGNWFVHAKNLQTKVDAAAFAGGTAWGFPCGADIDAEIETQARNYFGSHIADDLTSVSSPHNPQVGGVGGDRHYLSLNQAQWWGGSFSAPDFSDPAGSVCQSKILDVKATERDVSPLWKLIPLFPDVKRKARVQIEEVAGLTGLLPIAVRLPQPLSAAAVFYNEASPTKAILNVEPFRQMCTDFQPTCIIGAPPSLGQWTTEPDPADPSGTFTSFNVRAQTGVVIATSVRPLCGAGTPPAVQPCLDMSPTPAWAGRPIDDFCRQASSTVRCFDADGTGPGQTVSEGVHFLLGHPTGSVPAGPNWPEFRGSWLGPGTCPANGYFNSIPGSCEVELNIRLDAGSCMRGPAECFDDPGATPPIETRTTVSPNNIQVSYCQVRTGQTGDVCGTQFSVAEQMNCTGSTGDIECVSVTGKHPHIALGSRGNAFALQVELRNTTVAGFPACKLASFSPSCRIFLTGNGYAGDSVRPLANEILDEPIQRSFMGDIDRTTPVKWVRLTHDAGCDPDFDDRIIGHDYVLDKDAASQPVNSMQCFIVDLGVAGGLARDQDEPPIAFNLGDNSSQRAYIDCDRDLNNLKSEIVTGCQWPSYAANRFDTTPYCPDHSGWFDQPKPDPFANWPPFRCVLTQTGNSSQVIQGFNERIFKVSNNPDCPDEVDPNLPAWGRNYWHRSNNDYDNETFRWDGTGPPGPNGTAKGNTLNSTDPRLVSLFFTTYDSFTDTGNEVYPIVGFGNFYVTGYGETISGHWKNGAPEDPCDEGNDGDLMNGTGNEPPPDLDMSRNTRWVWGHFVKDVVPAPFSTGGSGILCNPEASFQPCVAVLVE
jgi:Putative Flp pilus-assembly TadE/G-like